MNPVPGLPSLTATAALLAALLVPGAAEAIDRALIMGVSDTRGAPLDGVRKDMVSAQAIARALGVKDEAITLRRDGELTLAGLKRTLADFVRSVQPGDRAFVYFSGHGTRFSSGKGACGAALVAQDLGLLERSEFDVLLQPMFQRAAKSVVMLDTCHSGAVISGSRAGAGAPGADGPRAKFIATDEDVCAQPSNVSRAAGAALRAEPPPNHYLLAGAGETEVAIDGGLRDGGYATTAVAECLALPTDAMDTNRDGLVTFSELRQCAQGRMDTKIRTERSRPPAFDFTRQTLTESVGPGGDLPLFARPAAAAASDAAAPVDARALLDTLHRGRDGTRPVVMSVAKSEFRIGQDLLDFAVTSERRGYVFVFAVGSSGKIDLLFPNRADGMNLVEAGQTLRLPREGWRLRSQGPKGATALLAVVTDGADWLGELGNRLGPFSRLDNRAEVVQDLARRLHTESRCGNDPAPAGAEAARQRDFGLETTGCAARYGAARAEVRER